MQERLEAFVHIFNNDCCLVRHLNFLLPSNEMVAFVVFKSLWQLGVKKRGEIYMHDTKATSQLKC